MSSIKITSSTIKKLGHEILEIRTRTLKHIEGKINRALLQNDPIIFHSGYLLKELIRWFGQKPLCEEETVLCLMITILNSTYIHDAIKFLGLERLKKEIGKIYEIVKTSSSKKLVCDIKEILEKYTEPGSGNTNDDDDDIGEEEIVIDLNSSNSSKTSSSVNCLYSGVDVIDDEFSPDYEKPWSTPSVPDYNSLKYLRDSLSSESNENELNHAFNYLYTAINDYPAEYFLQPPYIFKALLMFQTKDKRNSEHLFRNFINLTKSILGRVKMRRQTDAYSPPYQENKLPRSKTQLTVSRYCVELFNLCLQQLKEPFEDTNEDESYLTFVLLFEILNLIEANNSCYIPKQSILIDLSSVAKYYRQSLEIDQKPNRVDRIRYIIIIYLMVRVINFDDKNEEIQNSGNKSPFKNVSGKCEYNPNNYLYESTNESKQFLDNNNQSDSWYIELETALLDVPIKNNCPKFYEDIKKSIKIETRSENSTVRLLLSFEKYLIPVISLLRQPDEYSDEEFIFHGIEALDILSIFQSLEFTKKLINAISKCIPLFDGNQKLKEAAENILLRLFAHENLKIKRLTYKEASNSMKHFFGQLMQGELILNKMYGSDFKRAKCLGIPLNVEILNEIICFGCQNNDSIVRVSAETMLCLIIKGKSILGKEWESYLEILLPNLPLLQCLETKDSGLGKAILDMLDPDNDFPTIDMIQGNIRFLFSPHANLRYEALSRLIYIISSHTDNKYYVPNILQISDTLPNDICILATPRDPEKIFSSGYYDRSTVSALLELLKSSDVEPSVRKTTLLQLNVICQDPELVEMIYCDNGWYLALQALDNSLKKDPINDYPDTAISAIGIISKIVLCCPQFRRDLSNEGNIYFLLMRALFIFHNDIVLKQDCVLILFLLILSPYAIGTKNITLPIICSRLISPLKCDFHWNTSPFEQKSLIEEIFLDIRKNNDENSEISQQNIPNTLSTASSSSIATTDLCKNYLNSLNKNSNIKSFRLSDFSSLIKESILQYFRLTFALVWFNGFDYILKELKMKGKKNERERLEYSTIYAYNKSTDCEEIIIIKDALDFNKQLELTSDDIVFIKYSSITENIATFLKRISNAISIQDVTLNTARIKLCLMFNHHVKSEEFLNTFRRFLLIIPNSNVDSIIFENIIEMMSKLLEVNDEKLMEWILEDLQDSHCVMLLLLKNYECRFNLYKKVCEFLKILMKNCIFHEQKESIKKFIIAKNGKDFYNIYNKLFDYVITITEECFHKKYLNHVRSLLSLLHMISCSRQVDLDSGYIPLVAKKLLYFIRTLKSFTEAGSHLLKNCLYIIGNLLDDIDEFVLEAKYIKFLSGLCGHNDFQIRALSWQILSKMCSCFKGAHLVIKELSFLPGGFHACCLSTFLDPQEVPLVRETAGGAFSNLLTYPKIDSIEGLHMAVAPLCIEQEPLDSNSNGIGLILQVFSKHRFLQTISTSLEYFHLSDFICPLTTKGITTFGIVRKYCSILINIIDIHPKIIDTLMETSAIGRILNLIKCVPTCNSKSSLKMTSEICNLLLRLLQPGSKFLERTISRDQDLIVVLISLLNLSYFENFNKTLLITVMQVLKILGNETIGFQLICEIISTRHRSEVCWLFCNCLALNENQEYQKACLTLIISLLVKSQTEEFKFETFAQILDSTNINNGKSHQTNQDQNKNMKNTKPCNVPMESTYQNNTHKKESIPMKRSLEATEKHYEFASEIIFSKIKDIFEVNFSNKCGKFSGNLSTKKIIICDAIAILLKTSSRARCIAQNVNFLEMLIARFKFIFKYLGTSCADFIRKNGDSKKDPIVQEFIVLYNILLCWFSVDCLTNDEQILELTKILIQSWPWLSQSCHLRNNFIKFLTFLSEDSIPVCKQFSTTIPNYTHSILQLTCNQVITETNKVKHPKIDFSILELGLRIISNCSCCIEGRLLLVKINILDIFNKFHPSITKMQKTWNTITILWLKFWEIFSRYTESSTVRHLSLLCTLIAKGNRDIRNLCISILRNMAFFNTNRSALLSSTDFLYTANTILSSGNRNEQLLMATALWRLVADNYKAKHTIKTTSIPRKLQCILKKEITDTENTSEQDDLINVVEILLKILNE